MTFEAKLNILSHCLGKAVKRRHMQGHLKSLSLLAMSGSMPFKGDTPSDLIVSILDRDPAPLLTGPLLPSELDWIVLQLVDHSFGHRGCEAVGQSSGPARSFASVG